MAFRKRFLAVIVVGGLVTAGATMSAWADDPTSNAPTTPPPHGKDGSGKGGGDKHPPKDGGRGDRPAPPAPLAATKLKVGDKAADLKVDKWLKGDFKPEAGKPYLVGFWIPTDDGRGDVQRLNMAARGHEGFKVAAIAVGRNSDKDVNGKRADKIDEMVSRMGDRLAIAVGTDPNQTLAKAWVGDVSDGTVPSAFLVGADGKIAWVGRPRDPGLRDALEKTVGPAKPPADGERPPGGPGKGGRGGKGGGPDGGGNGGSGGGGGGGKPAGGSQ